MPPRLSAAIFAFFLFLLVGPLAGSLAFGILMTAIALATEPDLGWFYLYASILFLPMAYLAGGMQAACTGLAAGLAVWRWGRTPVWAPLGAAVLAGAFHAVRGHEDWANSLVMLGVHIAAALICWRILRGSGQG